VNGKGHLDAALFEEARQVAHLVLGLGGGETVTGDDDDLGGIDLIRPLSLEARNNFILATRH
jgi:hypothetical protein